MKPKLCTDIEQSKKLAEILHVASADMHYAKVIHGFDLSKDWVYEIQLCAPSEKNHIPAWSMAALLNILQTMTLSGDCDEWKAEVYMYEEEEGKVLYDIQHIEGYADNPLDSVVNLIIQLKNKKLL